MPNIWAEENIGTVQELGGFKMKVHIKKKYYKRSHTGRSPATFKARQPEGIGGEVFAIVRLDPILRKRRYQDLNKAIMRHEKHEIQAWGNGHPAPHHHAKSRESKLTRDMQGVHHFWQEINRREKRG